MPVSYSKKTAKSNSFNPCNLFNLCNPPIIMIISSQTKISELVKANKDSIEAIASLSKPLEKLKNPLLRKLMASRVTIAEAAKMGGCSIEEFRLVLKPLGFEFGGESTEKTEAVEQKPDWLLQLPAEKIVNFDVRPILA